MFDYRVMNTIEARNLMEAGEIDFDDLPEDVQDAIEEEDAEAARAEYRSAYAEYARDYE